MALLTEEELAALVSRLEQQELDCQTGSGTVSHFNEGYPNVPEDFTITEKAPTRAFSWLKAPTSAFTFKTLLRHYAKRALTPRSLNVKLGLQRNYPEGRAAPC